MLADHLIILLLHQIIMMDFLFTSHFGLSDLHLHLYNSLDVSLALFGEVFLYLFVGVVQAFDLFLQLAHFLVEDEDLALFLLFLGQLEVVVVLHLPAG
jgi:hypothetical protein